MTTISSSFIEEYLDNATKNYDPSVSANDNDLPINDRPILMFFTQWILRFSCVFIGVACPWANYKLIELFVKRRFHKESSVKWYIIFKAIIDVEYMLISLPVVFCITFHIDIIHKNYFTCKLVTYAHYLSDDTIAIMLTLACIDRVLRITCGFRFRQRFSLSICITTLILLAIFNMHHILRLQHRNGFCHKTYITIWDYDFDVYYSLVYTCTTWTIILIASIILITSIYCDPTRRLAVLKQERQQQIQKNISEGLLNTSNDSIGLDHDKVLLINNTDDVEDFATVTIEPSPFQNDQSENEQQNIIDLQIAVCVLITSAIFLGCNLPSFIIFIQKFVYNATFSSIGYMFVYVSLFPLLIAHTITYFIFNHLAARIFPNFS